MWERWKARVRQLKQEIRALYLAYQDSRTPWYARILAIIIIAYALSPIDLIPDFIPILGYLDDIILIPLGIMLVLRLIPIDVMQDCRKRAEVMQDDGLQSVGRVAGIVIVCIWVIIAVWMISIVLDMLA